MHKSELRDEFMVDPMEVDVQAGREIIFGLYRPIFERTGRLTRKERIVLVL